MWDRAHRPAAILAALIAFILLTISLLSHGPAWLAGAALSRASRQLLAIKSSEGLWYRGSGRLSMAGVDESIPLSWLLEWRGMGVAVTLGDGVRGELVCNLHQGCASSGLDGRLPGDWLRQLAPALSSVGLDGQIDWHLHRLQWDVDGGGNLELDWHSDGLYAARLGLPLGWYAGTLVGQWSGAEREPRATLQLHSAPPAGLAPPLDVHARGQASAHSVEIVGQVDLTATADARYSRLLQMLGLTSSGGTFRYRSGG